MKKKLFTMLLALTLTASCLTACGDSNSSDAGSSSTTDSSSVAETTTTAAESSYESETESTTTTAEESSSGSETTTTAGETKATTKTTTRSETTTTNASSEYNDPTSTNTRTTTGTTRWTAPVTNNTTKSTTRATTKAATKATTKATTKSTTNQQNKPVTPQKIQECTLETFAINQDTWKEEYVPVLTLSYTSHSIYELKFNEYLQLDFTFKNHTNSWILTEVKTSIHNTRKRIELYNKKYARNYNTDYYPGEQLIIPPNSQRSISIKLYPSGECNWGMQEYLDGANTLYVDFSPSWTVKDGMPPAGKEPNHGNFYSSSDISDCTYFDSLGNPHKSFYADATKQYRYSVKFKLDPGK